MNDTRIIKNIVYAERQTGPLELDIYLPEGNGPFPVVAYVPGGGWRECNRHPAPDFILEAGWAYAVLSYRLSEDVKAPASVHDAKAFVRWIRANSAGYNLDPNRIVAWGGSAGGHLVSLIGLTPDVPELDDPDGDHSVSTAVAGVIDMCGPVELARAATAELHKTNPYLCELIELYIGGSIEEKMDLARLISPIEYVPRCSIPFLILHGDQDKSVPHDESIKFHDALKEQGADVTMRILRGEGHGWDSALTAPDTLEFLGRIGRMGDLPCLNDQ